MTNRKIWKIFDSIFAMFFKAEIKFGDAPIKSNQFIIIKTNS